MTQWSVHYGKISFLAFSFPQSAVSAGVLPCPTLFIPIGARAPSLTYATADFFRSALPRYLGPRRKIVPLILLYLALACGSVLELRSTVADKVQHYNAP